MYRVLTRAPCDVCDLCDPCDPRAPCDVMQLTHVPRVMWDNVNTMWDKVNTQPADSLQILFYNEAQLNSGKPG